MHNDASEMTSRDEHDEQGYVLVQVNTGKN